MMKILAHRGFWKKPEERNSIDALMNAIQNGYGIETDIRDYSGKLVISHNIADESCQLLDTFLSQYDGLKSDACLALNIKADGLQDLIKKQIDTYNIKNYFLFDMSIPEMVVNRKSKLKFYTRHSDIERECVLYDYADGVWLDSFYTEDWLSNDIINRHLADGKKICIISPEIHGFNHEILWCKLVEDELYKNDNMMLCTDIPDEAKEYFGL